MKILLKNITENLMNYEGSIECDNLINNGDEIDFIEPMKFIGTLKKGMDFVEISGRVISKFTTNCHLCGEKTEKELEFEIFETYRREPGEEEYPLVGDEVDFDDMILENFRRNLPVKILCKDDCKGICTKCGKNLNVEKCNCSNIEKTNPAFDVLNKLIK
jgi:uncharacterized protein